MKTRTVSGRLAPWLAAAGLALPVTSLAAGFAITEENATGLGSAYSDTATGNGNASGMFFNPATMSDLPGTQISGGMIYIDPKFKLKDGKSSVAGIGDITNGGDGGNAGVAAPVPNLFITHQLNARTHVGFGISVPYGLSTDYSSGWLGRYHAIKSEVQVINLNPALSFDANPNLSLGVGLDIQYANANLTSAIDSGSLCYGAASAGQVPGGTSTCQTYGLTPGNASKDGKVRVKGNDWALGWNAGLLWHVNPSTKIGLSYRSAVDHKLKGSVDYSNIPLLLASNPQLADTNARASLDLPATANLGISHAFSPRWTMTAGLLWTQWSRFHELRVTKDNGQPDIVTTEGWKDTLRYAVGASYKQNSRLTWRAGLAFDPTPVPDAQHRTARLPDSDRTWLSLGVGYHVTKKSTVDVGYTHIWFNNVKINNTTEGTYKNTLTGTYTGSVDMVGVQYSHRF
ncbi:MAG: outer membrane protein transport protein [Acidihalobacter sp.]|uniref:OmpP1/FadL family transporter n=1 Tax=Acidihalobacter sp. TaxID=1872108 RepID=UPI00307DB7FB